MIIQEVEEWTLYPCPQQYAMGWSILPYHPKWGHTQFYHFISQCHGSQHHLLSVSDIASLPEEWTQVLHLV